MAATDSSTATFPDGFTIVNFETRPSFSIRIFTIADIFAPVATMLFGCCHALLKRSWSIVPYQAYSDGCVVEVPEPLAESFFWTVLFDDVLESFFVGVDFFSGFSFAGFGVSLGSALFFGLGLGAGLGVGLGEFFGAGVTLGFGATVGVGVGDGIWISLLAVATLGAGSGFSISTGVGDGAGAVLGSEAAAASLFIQATVCKFAGVASRFPRA